MPLGTGLDAVTGSLRLHAIEQASTLAPLGLIMRRTAPRSALAEACFSEAASLLLSSPAQLSR